MNTSPIAKKEAYSYKVNGQEIVDYYHWLRDKNWPKVNDQAIIEHLEQENTYFAEFFKDQEITKEKIFNELKGRIKLTDQSVYIKKDDYYYYTRTEEEKEYPIYCRKHGSKEALEEIIIDVNQLAEGKNFTKVCEISISPDHILVAYLVDFSGDEKYTLKILNLQTREYLSDTIENINGDIVWHEKQSGFFYTPVNEYWRCDRVMFHKLGDDIKNDAEVFRVSDPIYQVGVGKTSTREYIIVNVGGHDSNESYFFSMGDKGFKPKLIRAREDKVIYDVDHNGDYFYIHTNYQAKNFQIVRIKTDRVAIDEWEDYIIEDKQCYLASIDLSKDYIILNYQHLALPLIKIQNINNNQLKTINFPDMVFSAGSYCCNFKENEIRVGYSSLAMPDTIYGYNFENNDLTILKQKEIPSGFNSSEYQVERIFAKNDDVEVPITILYKKSLFKKDGTNPLYLYGYGSYGYSIPVSFRSTAISMVDRGVVFAIAHIRGGDELGYDWYESAKFLNKKRTFSDFIACAERLIDSGYTSAGNIIACGGSAGGLLIGAVLNQRAELFKAAIAHVPFVDVLNTMLDETLPLTPGEFKEWGNPKESQYFDYIQSYSPYENIKEQNYPSIMVTAGISDQRVGYWEAAKWVAKLRELKTDKNLIIMKTNMDAGHAGASGRFEYLKEVVEDLVFMFKIFNIKDH